MTEGPLARNLATQFGVKGSYDPRPQRL